MIRQLLVAIVVASILGCAAWGDPGIRRTPVKPPTPADDLSREELEATPKPDNEQYYAIMFGSQSTPKLPRFTHTWAAVVKATWTPGQPEPTLELHSISWMPATLHIRTFSRHPEPGVNLGMHETIAEMKAKGERVSMWGPYLFRTSTYRRFLVQEAFMQSGAIGYQCLDNRGEAARCGNACDCIHAITDMDPVFDRKHYPLRWYGEKGSERIVEQCARRGALLDGARTQDWLIPRLGLDCPEIVRRCYTGPVGDLIQPPGCR